MKFIVVFALVIATVWADFDQKFKDDMMKKIQEWGSECAEKEGATGDDIGELLAKKPPSRKEGKCLLACMNQKFELQDKDGKFSMEGGLKSIEPFKTADAAVYEKLKLVLEKCVPTAVGIADRCDAALKYAGCAKKESQAQGISAEMLM